MLVQESAEAVCVVRRTLPARCGTVYHVWTDPDHVARWSWGKDFETVLVDMDIRVGGTWHQHVRNKETGENWGFDGVFQEIDPGRKLVHTFHWHSEHGVEEGPTRVAIELTPAGKRTDVTITHSGLPAEKCRSTEASWEDILNCITECLSVRMAL
jgi:uncharacterized protein YndB with AHSA1/START domain